MAMRGLVASALQTWARMAGPDLVSAVGTEAEVARCSECHNRTGADDLIPVRPGIARCSRCFRGSMRTPRVLEASTEGAVS